MIFLPMQHKVLDDFRKWRETQKIQIKFHKLSRNMQNETLSHYPVCSVSFVSFRLGSIRPEQGRRAYRRALRSPLKGLNLDQATEPTENPSQDGFFVGPAPPTAGQRVVFCAGTLMDTDPARRNKLACESRADFQVPEPKTPSHERGCFCIKPNEKFCQRAPPPTGAVNETPPNTNESPPATTDE